MCDQCGCEDQLSYSERYFGEYPADYSKCDVHPDTLVPWGIDCPKCIEAELAAEDAEYDAAMSMSEDELNDLALKNAIRDDYASDSYSDTEAQHRDAERIGNFMSSF